MESHKFSFFVSGQSLLCAPPPFFFVSPAAKAERITRRQGSLKFQKICQRNTTINRGVTTLWFIIIEDYVSQRVIVALCKMEGFYTGSNSYQHRIAEEFFFTTVCLESWIGRQWSLANDNDLKENAEWFWNLCATWRYKIRKVFQKLPIGIMKHSWKENREVSMKNAEAQWHVKIFLIICEVMTVEDGRKIRLRN